MALDQLWIYKKSLLKLSIDKIDKQLIDSYLMVLISSS